MGVTDSTLLAGDASGSAVPWPITYSSMCLSLHQYYVANVCTYVCACISVIRYVYIYMEVHVHIQYVLIQFYTSIGEYHARTAIDVPRDVCTHKQADVTA